MDGRERKDVLHFRNRMDFNWRNPQGTCTRLAEAGNRVLFLVDNASGERALERVARGFPDLDIRRLPSNSGHTGGNNFALRLAREGDYDCLLISNNDVEAGPRAVEVHGLRDRAAG